MSARVRTSLPLDGLCALAAAQVNSLFPDGEVAHPADLVAAARASVMRVEECFTEVDNRYFFDGTTAVFDHLHGDQYAMWLCFLARELHLGDGAPHLRKKIFLLKDKTKKVFYLSMFATPFCFHVQSPLIVSSQTK